MEAVKMRRTLRQASDARQGRYDYNLTSEEYKFIQTQFVTAIRTQLKARRIFENWFTPEMGEGVQEYGYDTISEMSAAEIAMNFKDPSLDVLNITRSTAKLPVIQRGFLMPRRMIATSRRSGTDLETRYSDEAGYQIGKQENTLIFQGWALVAGTYDINGFYQGAGSDYSTSKDFATAGNPSAAIAGSIALSEAQSIYGPYKNILNTVQMAQLNASVLSSGVREKEVYRDLLNDDEDDLPSEGAAFKGVLTKAPQITAGTGLLVGNNPVGAKILMAADARLETWPYPPKGTAGLAWSSLVPLIYNAYTFTKMSVI
jgi:uncharacterized linocin/CFP29 family protein